MSSLRKAARALACSMLVLSVACRGPEQEPDRHRSERELTMETFRELISQGTLEPVDSMEKDVFAPFEEGGMRDDEQPFEDFPFRDPEDVDLESLEADDENYVELPLNPYVEFGDRIIVYPDGRIAKMYPLRSGTGKKLQELMNIYAPFPIWTKEEIDGGQADGEVGATRVRVELHEGWDIELVSDLRANVADAGTPRVLADWLVAVASPELLREVEDFINTFAAGVPQIEIEAKIVEVTVTEALTTGVGQVDDATPIIGLPDTGLIKSLGFDFPVGGGGAATLGAIQDGVTVNAVLEALATFENVSIISRPKVAVREGGRAQIINTTEVPFFNITGISSANGQFGASLTFKEVGVQMYVVPRVVGTEAVALNIDIEVSQESGTAVTFVTDDDSQITNPIIAKRKATTIVYLEPGQAVILGGLITERTVETEEKVPVLGDIPILGYLFKRSSREKELTNVLFFIRPRILQGADVNREF